MAPEQQQVTAKTHSFVVVSNRLPVDRVVDEDGVSAWRTSPGGLVTAMESVVRDLGCAWVGWPGDIGEEHEPFQTGSMALYPLSLDETEFEEYYEGFSNDTIWPLYHDVIAPPRYRREWWERYRAVNRRFAAEVANVAAQGATVWVHDYQLQLVPAMLRELRPDLTIGFFMHIPFPGYGLFAQLPWRTQVLEGVLGADVVGFQRSTDALNFRVAAQRLLGIPARGNMVQLREEQLHRIDGAVTQGSASSAGAGNGGGERRVLVQEFPISIDAQAFEQLAKDESVQKRAAEIRNELGNPRKVILGVDRLDYTKGIRHRLKAFSELWQDGELTPGEVTMLQVASPSRERVAAYRQLRNEIEVTVSRINGDFGTIGHMPVVYLHRSFPREEMAALYLAADVMVVTALRDGMNLVAKEYIACRPDERGALVLSEFTGAAEELKDSLLINPHDIAGLKRALMRALRMPDEEQQERMRAMRHIVFRSDVANWSSTFLRALEGSAASRGPVSASDDARNAPAILSRDLEEALRRLAASPTLLVACDFDGTLAPIVERPEQARILKRAELALSALQEAQGVSVALISGRSLESLAATGVRMDGRIVSGSHGAELSKPDAPILPGAAPATHDPLTADEGERLARLREVIERAIADDDRVANSWIEEKPLGVAVHIRQVEDELAGEQLIDRLALDASALNEDRAKYFVRRGKKLIEFTVRDTDKGTVLRQIASKHAGTPVLFIGDDVTDEDAMRVLGLDDVGVRVGGGESVAQYRVDDPATVSALLAKLVELRTGAVVSSD